MINIVEDWHWWVVGTLILVLSSLSRSTTMILAGLAAIIIGFVLTVDPLFPVKHQIGGFFVLSTAFYLISTLFTRGKNQKEALNEGPGAAFVGKTFTLEYPIIEGSGTLKIDGKIWSIEGKDQEHGVDIRVIASRGETLLVVSEASAQKFEEEKARRAAQQSAE